MTRVGAYRRMVAMTRLRLSLTRDPRNGDERFIADQAAGMVAAVEFSDRLHECRNEKQLLNAANVGARGLLDGEITNEEWERRTDEIRSGYAKYQAASTTTL